MGVDPTLLGTIVHDWGTDVDILIKATPGTLRSAVAWNINAAIRYLQVHNKITAPANPDVPVLSIPMPAGTATAPSKTVLGRDELGEAGILLTVGISIGISTTKATFTAATPADHELIVKYM